MLENNEIKFSQIVNSKKKSKVNKNLFSKNKVKNDETSNTQ